MNLLGIGSLVQSIGSVADELFTSDEERLKAELAEKRLNLEAARIAQAGDLAQIKVNEAEAKHRSLFVAGWRPAIGWIGAFGLGFRFIIYPICVMFGLDYATIPNQYFEAMDFIILGMLGLNGSMRTFEKVKGVTK